MVIAVASLALVVDLDGAHGARRARLGRARCRCGPATPRRSRAGAVDWSTGAAARARRSRPGSASWCRRRRGRSTTTAPRPTTGATPSGSCASRALPPPAAGPIGRPRRDGGARPSGDRQWRAVTEHYVLTVNGAEPRGRRTPGSARACSTCCASGWACPARRTPASRASAARARCDVDGALVCACLVLAATRRRPRRHHRRGPGTRARRAHRRAAGRSSTRAPCSAGSARPAWSWRCTTCSTARPTPTDLEVREAISGNLCRCTGYGRVLAAVEAAVDGPARVGRSAAGRVTDDRHRRPTPAPASGPGGSGTSAARPDGVPKVRGGSRSPPTSGPTACCGARTLRSPHPHARIRSIDIGPALAMRRRRHASSPPTTCPARRSTGSSTADQPVFASEVVRYAGEPVAAVAADHPDTARRAAAAIVVDYERARPGHRRRGRARRAATSTPTATCSATCGSATATRRPEGRSWSRAPTRSGCRTRRSWGPRPAWPSPARTAASTCRVHAVAPRRPRPDRRVPRAAAGAGAAHPRRRRRGVRRPRGRQPPDPRLPARPAHRTAGEDGLHPGGVVPRPRPPPPGRIWMRHNADPDGPLVSRSRRASCSTAAPTVVELPRRGQRLLLRRRPVRRAERPDRGLGVRTNNPPCGAMRGFGAVQACFAHEAQMDKLAAALRPRPGRAAAAQRDGPRRPLLTGQVVDGTLPVAEVIRATAAPAAARRRARRRRRDGPSRRRGADHRRRRRAPGRRLRRRVQEPHVLRGLRRLLHARVPPRGRRRTVTCAAAEVGQGFVTLCQQIVREVLGVDDVLRRPGRHRRSARPARPRPAGRRGCRAARWRRRAGRCGPRSSLDVGRLGRRRGRRPRHRRRPGRLGRRAPWTSTSRWRR